MRTTNGNDGHGISNAKSYTEAVDAMWDFVQGDDPRTRGVIDLDAVRRAKAAAARDAALERAEIDFVNLDLSDLTREPTALEEAELARLLEELEELDVDAPTGRRRGPAALEILYPTAAAALEAIARGLQVTCGRADQGELAAAAGYCELMSDERTAAVLQVLAAGYGLIAPRV